MLCCRDVSISRVLKISLFFITRSYPNMELVSSESVIADMVPNLFCAMLFSLFFMVQQVHTQPVVTTASSTTDKPNRAPRIAVEVLFTSDLNSDWFVVF